MEGFFKFIAVVLVICTIFNLSFTLTSMFELPFLNMASNIIPKTTGEIYDEYFSVFIDSEPIPFYVRSDDEKYSEYLDLRERLARCISGLNNFYNLSEVGFGTYLSQTFLGFNFDILSFIKPDPTPFFNLVGKRRYSTDPDYYLDMYDDSNADMAMLWNAFSYVYNDIVIAKRQVIYVGNDNQNYLDGFEKEFEYPRGVFNQIKPFDPDDIETYNKYVGYLLEVEQNILNVLYLMDIHYRQ